MVNYGDDVKWKTGDNNLVVKFWVFGRSAEEEGEDEEGEKVDGGLDGEEKGGLGLGDKSFA